MNAIILVYWQELIWRQDGYETLEWIFLNSNFFCISVLAVFFLELGLVLLSNSIFMSVLVINLLSYGMSVINYIKYDLKGEVFQFADLTLIREAALVLNEFSVRIHIYMIVGGISGLIRCILAWHCEKYIRVSHGKKRRIGNMVFGFLICSSILKLLPLAYDLGGNSVPFYIAENYYDKAGVMAGFFRTLPQKVEKPQGYSKKMIENVIESAPESAGNEEMPDVIFIMEESLCDITLLDGVVLSADPLESFHEYQERFTSGKIFSPVFGGNTCQVEFEVLTGYPSCLVSGNAYTDYIDKEIDSLVSLYNDKGYDTYAYHPNTGAFFNRNYVYKNMGFKHIIFETDFKLPLKRVGEGGWTDDESLFDNIIFDYQNRDTSVPYFAFAVTTQNHGGYDWDFTKETFIDVISAPGQDDSHRNALSVYSNLCRYTDIALNKLICYFETVKKPVLIIVWGDHAPSYGFFGAESDGSLEKYLAYHTTPLLIWDNYDLPQKDLGYLSAYRLGACIADLTGINDPYMNLLTDSDCPNVIEGLAVTRDGDLMEAGKYSAEDGQYMDKIWQVEYDRLFGKNYYSRIIEEQ